jgi:hypothetical protein
MKLTNLGPAALALLLTAGVASAEISPAVQQEIDALSAQGYNQFRVTHRVRNTVITATTASGEVVQVTVSKDDDDAVTGERVQSRERYSHGQDEDRGSDDRDDDRDNDRDDDHDDDSHDDHDDSDDDSRESDED